jgi:hypothetical protein
MKLRALLVLFLIASSNCGLFDAIKGLFCRVNLLLTAAMTMINQAKAGKGLVMSVMDKAINDPQCGGYYALSQLTKDLQGLYHLGKQADDLLNKLFNFEYHLEKVFLDQKMQVWSDEAFDYSVKLGIKSDTTLKPSDNSVVYNIKGSTVFKEGSGDPEFKVDNPAVKKIKELTGFDVTKMEASLERKLSFLPDGKFTIKANLKDIELTYTSTAKLGNTDLTGSIGFIIESSLKPNQPSAVSQNLETAKAYVQQLADSGTFQKTALYGTAALAIGLAMAGAVPATAAAGVTAVTVGAPKIMNLFENSYSNTN